ncbi:MAG: alpha/beta fold hydrolase [Thermomicrobiales bacterium]|nr:alpha/beta fold hydrolase [Thermomicrobiales bacterium]
MATVVKMPKWGLTMTAGTVTDWLRDEGSEISEGDPLLTVETEKAVNDVEAPADGILLKIVAGQGAEVPVSGAVAIIAAPGEVLSDAEIAELIESASPKKAGSAAKRDAAATGGREGRTAARDASGRVNASPAARKLAGELGIDLAGVEATGPGGRITSDDVERAAAERDEDPTPVEKRVTLADGREINALVAGPGSGPKIVFLHGLGGSQSTWQVVLGDLVEQYRVTAIDLPGHGASDKSHPSTTDYGVESLAAAVADAVGQLKAGPAIVAGHSLGGAVAMQLALDRPDLVRGLVLINSAGLGEEIGAELIDLMAGEPGHATARGLLELFYEDMRLVLERGIEEMAQTQLAEGAWIAQQAVATAAFSGSSQQLGLPDRHPDVAQPVLIIWGAKDRVIPISHAIDALRTFPDATLRVLPNVGHVPQVEDAATVAKAIDRFARSLT